MGGWLVGHLEDLRLKLDDSLIEIDLQLEKGNMRDIWAMRQKAEILKRRNEVEDTIVRMMERERMGVAW